MKFEYVCNQSLHEAEDDTLNLKVSDNSHEPMVAKCISNHAEVEVCIGDGNSQFPFSSENPVGMGIDTVRFGNGTRICGRKWK